MKILFLDYDCGFAYNDPIAVLVQINKSLPKKELEKFELSQPGVSRTGGNWKKIIEDAKATYKVIREGNRSDFEKENYDFEYELITGNY
jgi:hypothetical protein